MRGKFLQKKAGAKQTTKLDNAPDDGASLQPPLMMVLFALAEIGWGGFTNYKQISTSMTAFGGSIALHLVKGADPGSATSMALVIAVSVQILTLVAAWPVSVVWHQLLSGHFYTTPGGKHEMHSSKREVSQHHTMREGLGYLALIGNVLGDVLFAHQTTTDYVSSFFFSVLMTASSTIILLDGFQRLWGGVKSWKEFSREFKARAAKPAGSSAKP
jgi:hypothetical protein